MMEDNKNIMPGEPEEMKAQEGEFSDDTAEAAAGGAFTPGDNIKYKCVECGKRYEKFMAVELKYTCIHCKARLIKDVFF